MMKVMLLPISVMAVILINCCQHVEGFFPYFQPFPYIRRRPARPQNPIYVQADRISKGSDRVIGFTNRRDGEVAILSNPHGSGGECRRDYHCKGRQKCVRRLGRYICTFNEFCNRDNDCAGRGRCKSGRCR